MSGDSRLTTPVHAGGCARKVADEDLVQVRPSFALDNTHDEVDALLRAASHFARR
jgi:selenocysteine lyase/cysteine desulfurase